MRVVNEGDGLIVAIRAVPNVQQLDRLDVVIRKPWNLHID